MTRLRWKLLAAMVTLVAVTIGLSAVLARRVTHDQVHRLLITRAPFRFDEVARALGDHHRTTGGWSGIDAETVWQMPTTFIGSPAQIRDDLLARRARFGLSYLVAAESALPALAEIVGAL